MPPPAGIREQMGDAIVPLGLFLHARSFPNLRQHSSHNEPALPPRLRTALHTYAICLLRVWLPKSQNPRERFSVSDRRSYGGCDLKTLVSQEGCLWPLRPQPAEKPPTPSLICNLPPLSREVADSQDEHLLQAGEDALKGTAPTDRYSL